jgi:RND family efflux transporter MFP subunit
MALMASISALILIMGVCACGQGTAKAVKSEEYAIPVAVDKVKLGTARDVVSTTGNIAPETLVTLFSNVPGAVTQILVKEGDKVKKGQIVALIDKEKAALQEKQAQAGLDMARANLANMEANRKRLEGLYKQNAIPKKMWDDIETGCLAAKGQVDQVESMLGLARSQLNDANITSTMNGVVAKRHLDPGEVVTSAQMMKVAPIVTIITWEAVKVLIGINEKDSSRIKVGQTAEIRVDAWPGRTFTGKVTNIAPIVNPLNRTVEVEVMIDNKDGALKPGMFARVNIVVNVHENAVVIPFDAVIESEAGRNVYVVEGDRAVRRDIKSGYQEGVNLEVASGVKSGENLVVLGQQRLKDGVRVKPLPIGGLK